MRRANLLGIAALLAAWLLGFAAYLAVAASVCSSTDCPIRVSHGAH